MTPCEGEVRNSSAKVSQVRVKYGKVKKGHGAVWWGEGNDW